jgi:hypothetical protein
MRYCLLGTFRVALIDAGHLLDTPEHILAIALILLPFLLIRQRVEG